jgi:hypothetical protein
MLTKKEVKHILHIALVDAELEDYCTDEEVEDLAITLTDTLEEQGLWDDEGSGFD